MLLILLLILSVDLDDDVGLVVDLDLVVDVYGSDNNLLAGPSHQV